MYASNLQELLFYCCERSDFSSDIFAEFTERFNALRNYGHLPRGRENRKQLLTPTQIALAILGLVPTRPSWAGHAATVLKTLSPVGGPPNSFFETASLIEAVTLVLTDKHEELSSPSLFYCFVDFGASLADQPKCWVVPSAIVATALRTTHQTWLASPGKHGQPHKDSNVRRLLPHYKVLASQYPLGWLDRYYEAWTLLDEVVATS
jgi:hypothetical protein